jgi:hypothetical protein
LSFQRHSKLAPALFGIRLLANKRLAHSSTRPPFAAAYRNESFILAYVLDSGANLQTSRICAKNRFSFACQKKNIFDVRQGVFQATTTAFDGKASANKVGGKGTINYRGANEECMDYY